MISGAWMLVSTTSPAKKGQAMFADIFGFWGWFWIIIFLIGIGQVFSETVKIAEKVVKNEEVQEGVLTAIWVWLRGGK
jgi:hypothetical protein